MAVLSTEIEGTFPWNEYLGFPWTHQERFSQSKHQDGSWGTKVRLKVLPNTAIEMGVDRQDTAYRPDTHTHTHQTVVSLPKCGEWRYWGTLDRIPVKTRLGYRRRVGYRSLSGSPALCAWNCWSTIISIDKVVCAENEDSGDPSTTIRYEHTSRERKRVRPHGRVVNVPRWPWEQRNFVWKWLFSIIRCGIWRDNWWACWRHWKGYMRSCSQWKLYRYYLYRWPNRPRRLVKPQVIQ